MKRTSVAKLVVMAGFVALAGAAQMAGEYKVLKTEKVGGEGGFDYLLADAVGRKLYIPRGNRVTVFDLDTLKPAGEIAKTAGVHQVAIDSASHHGVSSSNPVIMWDTETLATIKEIPVQGRPDGIVFDSFTNTALVLSHREPNLTAVDTKEGKVVGTLDLGGQPEEAASDGVGHVYVALEDKDEVAVVDPKALKVTARYPLGEKGGGPSGLAMDVKNRVLFVTCADAPAMVVLNADTGKILATIPTGAGTDGAMFNPATMEAFSTNRDGTLTVVKEKSPTEFELEQTLTTKVGGKTGALDNKTNLIYVITADRGAAPATTSTRPARGAMVPGSFQILVIGK